MADDELTPAERYGRIVKSNSQLARDIAEERLREQDQPAREGDDTEERQP